VYPDGTGTGAAAGAAKRREVGSTVDTLEADANLSCSCLRSRLVRQSGQQRGGDVRLRASRDHGGGGLSRWPDRLGSTCGAESHASGHACGCSAGMCASSCSLLRFWRGARITETLTPQPRGRSMRAPQHSARFPATWTRQTRRREGRPYCTGDTARNSNGRAATDLAGPVILSREFPLDPQSVRSLHNEKTSLNRGKRRPLALLRSFGTDVCGAVLCRIRVASPTVHTCGFRCGEHLDRSARAGDRSPTTVE
jgi:hypothetical protein